eukprot:Hpha_TRINITY_DN16810_c2_g3::TRINITY_DN16810_c2_g3_i1::g.150812::m.150812
MDVRFVEFYEATLGTVTGAAITGAAFMSLGGYGTSEVAWVVLSAGVFGVLWTALYPQPCSVRMVMVWKALGYASVALSAGAALYADSSGSEPDTFSRVFFVASFALPLAVSIGNSITARCHREEGTMVTPEDVQDSLILTAESLQKVGALAPQFSVPRFSRQVRSSIRASPLALLAMKLEDSTRMHRIQTVFLGSRPTWYRELWGMVQTHDDERDFSRHLISWEEAWWELYCDCFCDFGRRHPDRGRELEFNEEEHLIKVEEQVRALANGTLSSLDGGTYGAVG